MTVPFDLWFAFCGASVQGIRNFVSRRPMYVGVHKYAIFSVLGFMLGTQANRFRDRRLKENEIYLLDYVSQHPEDFNQPPPKKFGEFIEPWHPQR